MSLRRLADAAALVVTAVTAFVLSLAPVSDVDFFWHLAVGRHIAQTGALPGKNLWSFTAPDHPFAATAWLFDWCAWQLQAAFGIAGVQVAAALVIAAAFTFVYRTARALGAGPGWALALTLAAEAASQTRFTQRPHIMTWLFLAALGWLAASRGQRRWPLAVMPLVVALWSNFHAGAVFGAGLVGLLAIHAWLERLRRRPADVWGWSLCAAACVVALVANPSGLDEVTYALFHLRSVKSVVDLSEFGSPTLEHHGAFWILLVTGAIALVARGRSADLGQVLAFVAFGVLAVRAMYVAPMFTLVTAPFTAANLAALFAGRATAPFRTALALLGPGLALLAGLSLAPEPLAHFAARVSLGVDPFLVPAPAARWVKANGINGRCFSSWDVSGYVEWELPDSPVYADPRLLAYPPEVFTALAAADESQAAFDALMDEHRVEWAFRTHRVLRMSGIGRFPPDRWALVYWDESSLIFLRRGLPKFQALIAQHEVKYFLPALSPFDSFRDLAGEHRQQWAREVTQAAARSALLSSAQLAVCLEEARNGNLGAAALGCDAAVAAVRERERFHPREGQARRIETAIAHAVLARGWQRAGNAERFNEGLAQAERLGRDSPEVFVAIGGTLLETDPKKALAYFEKALAVQPQFAPALKGRERALAAGK